MLKKTLTLAAAAAALFACASAFADPPRWAPAHGWRAKHYDHRPLGYDRHDRHYYGHYREKVVVHHYAPVVRHVHVPPRPVVVYHEPAYVVPGAVVGATPYGWSVDLRFGGGWR